MLGINTWFSMYSMAGWTFHYSLWYVIGSIEFTAEEALVLFVIGAGCGILTVVGAALQSSGSRSRVRRGSILVLVATIIGSAPTDFGYLIGGLLSILGAALGISWEPETRL